MGNKQWPVELTDDEIVDFVASYGLPGMPVGDQYSDDDGTTLLAARLMGMCLKEAWEKDLDIELEAAEEAVVQRFESITERVQIDKTETYYYLTPKEWGRRLARKGAANIEKALAGDTWHQ